MRHLVRDLPQFLPQSLSRFGMSSHRERAQWEGQYSLDEPSIHVICIELLCLCSIQVPSHCLGAEDHLSHDLLLSPIVTTFHLQSEISCHNGEQIE